MTRQTAVVTDRLEELARATADLEPPYAVLDLDAFDANAAELTRRAAGRATIRLASKSLRVRSLIARAAALEGYAGTLAFTLPEALWLAEGGGAVGSDVLIGYPTTHRAGLRRLAADEVLRSRVTLMVDSVAHLDLIERRARRRARSDQGLPRPRRQPASCSAAGSTSGRGARRCTPRPRRSRWRARSWRGRASSSTG